MIEHRVSGLLVPAGDALSLSDAIKDLSADAKLRESLGIEARRAAETTYTWRANAERAVAALRCPRGRASARSVDRGEVCFGGCVEQRAHGRVGQLLAVLEANAALPNAEPSNNERWSFTISPFNT